MRNPKEVQDYWKQNPINNHGQKCWWEKPPGKTQHIGTIILKDFDCRNKIGIEKIREKDKPELKEKCDCIIADCEKILEKGKNEA